MSAMWCWTEPEMAILVNVASAPETRLLFLNRSILQVR